jgi:site-specific DNA-methyltransferase (adenine-specific)/modification methylase
MKLPKPYYEDDFATIYCGDCREILPLLPKADLILTDPPYGVSYRPLPPRRKSRWLVAPIYGRELTVGDEDQFDPGFLLNAASALVLWGANHYADRLPARASWLVWDKNGGLARLYGQSTFADCELAWCSDGRSARIFPYLWNGFLRAGAEGRKPRLHPTQKPVALMSWCLERFPTAALILDPFMGSGTTLVAAKRRQRKCVGIEILPKYCEIARRRLAQEVLQLPAS